MVRDAVGRLLGPWSETQIRSILSFPALGFSASACLFYKENMFTLYENFTGLSLAHCRNETSPARPSIAFENSAAPQSLAWAEKVWSSNPGKPSCASPRHVVKTGLL